jgi:iron(III) transport system substrate-binding protein
VPLMASLAGGRSRRRPRARAPRATAVLLVLALAASLGGCARGRDALTVYSGRTENLVGPLLERFHDQTGIRIDVKYGDSPELALLIGEEGDRSPADVFLSQSPGATGYLAARDLLAPVEPRGVGAVDPAFRDPRNRWVGVTARQRVLVYNTRLVGAADLPGSVFDLTGARWSAKVGVAPTNGSFQDFVSAMRQRVGDRRTREWLAGLARNRPRTYANNNAIVAAVGRGEIPVGLVNHYYNYRFLAEDPGQPTRNHIFGGENVGSIVIPSTVSVLAAGDKREEATRFVEYLLTKDAQTYFRDQTFEYPLVGVAPSPGLPPLERDRRGIDIGKLGAELEGTLQLIRESGLEGA